MSLRIIIRNSKRIRLSEARQGDTLFVYESEDDLENGIGVRWELESDAFITDLSNGVWGCIGNVYKLES